MAFFRSTPRSYTGWRVALIAAAHAKPTRSMYRRNDKDVFLQTRALTKAQVAALE